MEKKGSIDGSVGLQPDTPNLSKGATFTKLGRSGGPGKRPFSLSPDGTKLVWKSGSWLKNLKGEPTLVDLTAVKRVTRGQTTIPFVRYKDDSKINSQKDKSFSVIYENHYGAETSLDMICETKEQCDTWFNEVTVLVKFHNAAKSDQDQVLRFARRQWAIADKDGSDTLDLKEITELIHKMNINLEPGFVAKKFKELDLDNSNTLDWLEFQSLLDLLNLREDIIHTWAAILDGDIFNRNRSVANFMNKRVPHSIRSETISAELFHRFLREVQGLDITLEQAELKMVAMKGTLDPPDKKLRYPAFKNYLTSADNSAFAIEKQANVYQDMTQPISHYWCASSHNTYCETDQLKGYSSVNRYINDMLKGCRCVELDCWDGPKGDPIIFHGHTLTGQISFKDVIEAVRDHAFTASEYPIILSFENHCSIPQQQKMAEYCKKIFKDMLYVPSLTADGKLPSLESCKRRILVKAKKLKGSAVDAEDEEEDDDKAEQDAAADEKGALLGESDSVAAPAEKGPKDKDKKAKKPKIAQELSDITFLGGCHFKTWEKSATESAANEMSSFSEPKTEKLISKSPKEWTEYNKRQMSRIYPAGFRIDSSNYNPVPSWNVGSQIVALNYQTSGPMMHLNDGKYMDNGNAGYVLKPECMRTAHNNFCPITGPFPVDEALDFSIEVMSASQLPKPMGATKGEVIDPYVMVELHGIPSDEAKYQTARVDNNGFNPVFNEKFTFAAKMKSLGLLYIAVYDFDMYDADDFIAYATIPLACLKPGIRNVNLRSWNGSNGGEFQFCSVMINVVMN
jgi:hypothetical protein